jgi:hypothetical protein
VKGKVKVRVRVRVKGRVKVRERVKVKVKVRVRVRVRVRVSFYLHSCRSLFLKSERGDLLISDGPPRGSCCSYHADDVITTTPVVLKQRG